MKFLLSPLVENVILVTAAINIVGVLIIFFTCRFIPSLPMAKQLTEKKWFKFIYKYHADVWWLLAPSVLIHAVIAILHKLSGG